MLPGNKTFRLASAAKRNAQKEITFDERCERVERIIDENRAKRSHRRAEKQKRDEERKAAKQLKYPIKYSSPERVAITRRVEENKNFNAFLVGKTNADADQKPHYDVRSVKIPCALVDLATAQSKLEKLWQFIVNHLPAEWTYRNWGVGYQCLQNIEKGSHTNDYWMLFESPEWGLLPDFGAFTSLEIDYSKLEL